MVKELLILFAKVSMHWYQEGANVTIRATFTFSFFLSHAADLYKDDRAETVKKDLYCLFCTRSKKVSEKQSFRLEPKISIFVFKTFWSTGPAATL